MVCPEGIQPCDMTETFTEEDTGNTVYNVTSVPFKVGPLGPHTVLPVAISCPIFEISSLSKVILVLGKARSHRAPNLDYSEAESPGWLDVSPKNSA